MDPPMLSFTFRLVRSSMISCAGEPVEFDDGESVVSADGREDFAQA
jgi:hypothetical protein